MSEPTYMPGDRVTLKSTGEKGLVICTWTNEHGDTDCYVAFFGRQWPRVDQKPDKPYVLRYYASSLEPAGTEGS